jgi:hypothetical protein
MILRETYLVTPASIAQEIEMPFEINSDDGSVARLAFEDDRLRLTRDYSVPVALEVERESGFFRSLPDGTEEPLPRLRIPSDAQPSHLWLEDIVDALSFLVDRPLASRRQGRGKLIPETEEEKDQIAEVGSDEPFAATGLTASIRTTSLEVGADNVRTLLDGPRIGVRLYADALRLPLPTSRFRELWRVLESAFGQKDGSLVKSLARYKPAVQLKFDASELNELLTPRGRASHAETKKPDEELGRVEVLCDQKLPRLFSLVERVILTKRTWGSRSGGVNKAPPPVMSYVGKDGGVVVIQNWKKQLGDADS